MRKAQVSMEYLIIVGFVTAITIPLIFIFNTHSAEVNEQIIANQADSIATKIVESAESVYYLGESSKVTFRVQMPEKITSVLIGNNEIVFFVNRISGTDQVVKWCPIPINGSIAYTPGIHKIVVESKGDYVLVSN